MPEPKNSFSLEEVKTMIAESTKETTKLIFEQFAPVLQSIALTPEKLREANKPYEDPADIARKNHEQREWRIQDEEKAKNLKARQERCTHKDKNGKWAINLQHNFHDNLPRGICPVCELYIEPMHWDWRPVTSPSGEITSKTIVVPAHPLYYIVQQLEYAQ